MKPSIEVNIDRVVLHGFENYNRHQIGEAIEVEITRLLQERGLPASFSSDTNVERLNAGNFTVQPNAKAAEVGNNIAQSVYNGLQSEKSST